MDTIQFRITDREKFRVASWALFTPEFSIRKFSELSAQERIRARNPKVPYLRHFVLHPEVEKDITVPKVEIYEKVDISKGEVKYELVISGSLPKILNENNIEEISVADRKKIIETISSKLRMIGIDLSPFIIPGAYVSVVHFCKNIAKVVHLYCGTREWTFYDKIEDLRQPKSRRTDKKRTAYEKEILEMRDLGSLEVLRYEYRLNKNQTIKSELNKLLGRPYETQVIFSDLFRNGLWQEVLLSSWKNVIKRPENQLALLSFDNPLELMLHIFRKAKETDTSAHSQNKALWSCALALLVKFCGAKTVKEELNKVWANKDDRLSEKLDTAANFVRDLPVSQGIAYITKELERFENMTLDILNKKAL